MSAVSAGASFMNQTAGLPGGTGLGLDDLVPQVLALPHALLLDVMSQARGGAAPAFAPGAAVAALRSLPHAGALAVAQADGRLSLWDARHRRHRLHFPPTCAFGAPDYLFTDAAAGEDEEEEEGEDDARWTALPRGCHKATRLKLSVYYRPAGLLQTTLAPAPLARAGCDGSLVREHAPEPAPAAQAPVGPRPAAAASALAAPPLTAMHIGLASVPGGLHAALRVSRPPCRVQASLAAAAHASDIAAAFAPMHERMFPDLRRKRGIDHLADEVLDAREGDGAGKDGGGVAQQQREGRAARRHAGHAGVGGGAHARPIRGSR
jgi:hypothetical protein